ncbi:MULTISPECIES: DNA distortion polypeptide 1 [Serratia]|uniref:DNA distortion polypeptide 1 n=1 Tax=Serratia TaxID=613 RepID=UPI00160123F5|nr:MULTISPECIES: DNA distortion polypeptide 1 [Serratia]MBB1585120.1 TraY domain-containing protein [Serratia sp. OS31]MBV6695273.1 TraY domain-containing protein [Serratia quinivorans]
MKEESRKIQIRLEPNDDAIFRKESTKAGLTPASLLKKIAMTIIANNNGAGYTVNDFNFTDNTEKLNVKVSCELKEKLQRAAEKNGWSLSKESRFRLASSLIDDPALYPDEVAELRRARNAVDIVGRNLHYIISKKQILTINDADFLEDVQRLNENIEALKSQVDRLTTLGINRSNYRKRGSHNGR